MNSSEFKKAILKATTPLPGSHLEAFTYQLTVKKKYQGLSILDFYCEIIPRSSKEDWINKINNQNLKVNNNSITIDYIVKAGDITTHTTEPKTEPEVNSNINLIYADENIWVIDKPSPLPVHASGRFVRNTLIFILEKTFPEDDFKLLHRIDANTTGVIIVAKNKKDANLMQQQFENKIVKKEYIALVEGILKKDTLTLTQNIGNEVLIAGARKVDPNGKEALTKIKVLERRLDKNQSLIKVTPLTGRTNQIRLHLAAINHPIVGDIGYKDLSYFETNPFTYNKDQLFLHAYRLSFIHPTTNKEMLVKAEIPKKFFD
ncbi:MAG: RluA family pseudouridine synthase [Vicingus serpentipes]|nr:RluA family pseudouridine synthase [Vicingus serpentipes]